ncbi:hypothetical protein, partial [Bradyrhizobium sp. CSA112]|uniref:hypothetical protein n=1 Tax=Bradyrhizobium sp. CSA112 TaxID=2699170 RepID=UPI0023B1C235
ISLMMLSLDTAYRSFGGEVEASSTPTICRLPDSHRHQLSAIAQRLPASDFFNNLLVLLSQSVAVFVDRNHIFEKTHFSAWGG